MLPVGVGYLAAGPGEGVGAACLRRLRRGGRLLAVVDVAVLQKQRKRKRKHKRKGAGTPRSAGVGRGKGSSKGWRAPRPRSAESIGSGNTDGEEEEEGEEDAGEDEEEGEESEGEADDNRDTGEERIQHQHQHQHLDQHQHQQQESGWILSIEIGQPRQAAEPEAPDKVEVVRLYCSWLDVLLPRRGGSTPSLLSGIAHGLKHDQIAADLMVVHHAPSTAEGGGWNLAIRLLLKTYPKTCFMPSCTIGEPLGPAWEKCQRVLRWVNCRQTNVAALDRVVADCIPETASDGGSQRPSSSSSSSSTSSTLFSAHAVGVTDNMLVSPPQQRQTTMTPHGDGLSVSAGTSASDSSRAAAARSSTRPQAYDLFESIGQKHSRVDVQQAVLNVEQRDQEARREVMRGLAAYPPYQGLLAHHTRPTAQTGRTGETSKETKTSPTAPAVAAATAPTASSSTTTTSTAASSTTTTTTTTTTTADGEAATGPEQTGSRGSSTSAVERQRKIFMLDHVAGDVLLQIYQCLDAASLRAVACTSKYLNTMSEGIVPGLYATLYPHQRASLWWMVHRERPPSTVPHPAWRVVRAQASSDQEDDVVWAVDTISTAFDLQGLAQEPMQQQLPSSSTFPTTKADDQGEGKEDSQTHATLATMMHDGVSVTDDIGTFRVGAAPIVMDCRGGFLCDEPGLGKTVTLLALILRTAKRRLHGDVPPTKARFRSPIDGTPHDATLPTRSSRRRPRRHRMDLRGSPRELSHRFGVAVNTPELARRWSSSSSSSASSASSSLPFSRDLPPVPPQQPAVATAPDAALSAATTQTAHSHNARVAASAAAELPADVDGLISSGATLLVVPDALVDHWCTQIDRHTCSRTLGPVYVDNDMTVPLPPAEDLAQFTIVLSTGRRLRKEWATGRPRRPRTRKRFSDDHEDGNGVSTPAQPSLSPLLRVFWFRLVVDEGHTMGNSDTANTIRMACLIEADRRWVMTGTPTPLRSDADALRHLGFLAQFLRIPPFYGEQSVWRRLVSVPFTSEARERARLIQRGWKVPSPPPLQQEDDPMASLWWQGSAWQLLQRMLRRIMMRHTKSQLPELQEPVWTNVRLPMSQQERDWYNWSVSFAKTNIVTTLFDPHRPGPEHQDSLLYPHNAGRATEAVSNVRMACCGGGYQQAMLIESARLDTESMLRTQLQLPERVATRVMDFISRVLAGRTSDCDHCGISLVLLMITPCGHLLCQECMLAFLDYCPLCDDLYNWEEMQKLQPGFEPGPWTFDISCVRVIDIHDVKLTSNPQGHAASRLRAALQIAPPPGPLSNPALYAARVAAHAHQALARQPPPPVPTAAHAAPLTAAQAATTGQAGPEPTPQRLQHFIGAAGERQRDLVPRAPPPPPQHQQQQVQRHAPQPDLATTTLRMDVEDGQLAQERHQLQMPLLERIPGNVLAVGSRLHAIASRAPPPFDTDHMTEDELRDAQQTETTRLAVLRQHTDNHERELRASGVDARSIRSGGTRRSEDVAAMATSTTTEANTVTPAAAQAEADSLRAEILRRGPTTEERGFGAGGSGEFGRDHNEDRNHNHSHVGGLNRGGAGPVGAPTAAAVAPDGRDNVGGPASGVMNYSLSSKGKYLAARVLELQAAFAEERAKMRAMYVDRVRAHLLQPGFVDMFDMYCSRGEASRSAMTPERFAEVRRAAKFAKIIVFSQFAHFLTRLALDLFSVGIPFVYFHGEHRSDGLRKFRDDPSVPVLLLPRDGSHGLDLSFVTHIFLMDTIMDEALEDQVVSRAYRMGAVGRVQVCRLIMRDTLEETMFSMLSGALQVESRATAENMQKLVVRRGPTRASVRADAAACSATAHASHGCKRRRVHFAPPGNPSSSSSGANGAPVMNALRPSVPAYRLQGRTPDESQRKGRARRLSGASAASNTAASLPKASKGKIVAHIPTTILLLLALRVVDDDAPSYAVAKTANGHDHNDDDGDDDDEEEEEEEERNGREAYDVDKQVGVSYRNGRL